MALPAEASRAAARLALSWSLKAPAWMRKPWLTGGSAMTASRDDRAAGNGASVETDTTSGAATNDRGASEAGAIAEASGAHRITRQVEDSRAQL